MKNNLSDLNNHLFSMLEELEDDETFQDKEKAERYAKLRNPNVKIFYISAKTGEGVEALAEEIIERVQAWNA